MLYAKIEETLNDNLLKLVATFRVFQVFWVFWFVESLLKKKVGEKNKLYLTTQPKPNDNFRK